MEIDGLIMARIDAPTVQIVTQYRGRYSKNVTLSNVDFLLDLTCKTNQYERKRSS